MQRRQFLTLALAGLAATACAGRPAAMSATPVASAGRAGAATATPAAPTTPLPAPALRPISDSAERVLLRDEDSDRLLGLDAASGKVLFSLAAQLSTADGKGWLALLPGSNATSVTTYDAGDGAAQRTYTVPGRFEDGAVSHNGRWLLLVQPPAAGATAPTSQMALLDLASGQVALREQLSGRYLADMVRDSADAIYLIAQHPERKSDAYAVMLYDATNHAMQGKIVDKRSGQGIMSGRKVSHAWSASGEWLYSLYLDPGGDGAFIHALNVSQTFSYCIDLPGSTQSEPALQQYALAVAARSDRVYAVNPALAVVNDFSAGAADATPHPLALPPGPDGLRPTVSATPSAIPGYRLAARPYNNSLVSPDGATLFAGTDRGILVIPTSDAHLQPSSTLLAGHTILSLGMGSGGQALYALVDGAPRRLLALDPVGGAVLSDLSGIVKRPLGIEQVAG